MQDDFDLSEENAQEVDVKDRPEVQVGLCHGVLPLHT
jgi:hypothetical protein